MDTELYRVKPGKTIHLKDFDPDSSGGYDGDKVKRQEELAELTKKLDALQELFYAAHKYALLIVLQGMDTSGKDGTIRHVFEGVNPQGVRVATFKAPTPQELGHDYLWRVHAQTPEKGEVVIFNRSHYEDVLIVRVHNLAPKEVWEKRYAEINHFEHELANEGTLIVKFYLHIDKKEQKQRLLDRLNTPEKTWKFNPEDLKERDYWDDYTEAYEEALTQNSTDWAPWYIVPANHKWFRDLVIANVLVKTLEGLKLKPPEAPPDLEKYRKLLEAE